MPKVSIIVPVYNVETYIEKCLDTLVNQTLKDIEIIVVNDGSKDRSENIIKKYEENYPGKVICLKKENGGLSSARNYGIPYAKGEYIAFLDSDDYVEKDMYETMYNLAKLENSDMVECDFLWQYPDKIKKDIGEKYEINNEIIHKIRVVAWNKLIKREIITENGEIRFPEGFLFEDVEFTYKLIPYLKKVSFCKKEFVHYIQRENSITNNPDKRVMEIFNVLDHVIDYYKGKGFYEKYANELEYIYVRYAFCSSLLRIHKIENNELQDELIEKTWEIVNNKFPKWKQNEVLKKGKGKKNLYLKTLNNGTYELYNLILSIIS